MYRNIGMGDCEAQVYATLVKFCLGVSSYEECLRECASAGFAYHESRLNMSGSDSMDGE